LLKNLSIGFFDEKLTIIGTTNTSSKAGVDPPLVSLEVVGVGAGVEGVVFIIILSKPVSPLSDPMKSFSKVVVTLFVAWRVSSESK
jgi:hypothetical protein